MTVKDLKKRLANLNDDLMVTITDGIGWSNIDKVETRGNEVLIFQETNTIFDED